MTRKIDHVTQRFLDVHPTHMLLWETLQQVVPHWNVKLKRRWIRDFMPYWRADLLDDTRQRRYLLIALRRGWFDEAAGARRWVTFIDQLAAHASLITPVSGVNLFNVLAALPVVPAGLQFGEPQRAAVFGDKVLDATALTACVEALMAEPGGDGSRYEDATSALYHVRGERALTRHGSSWLEQSWGKYGLCPVALLEPFGMEPWAMVSELGVDKRGVLVAYHRIENMMAELTTLPDHRFAFDGEPRRHEPVGLEQPEFKKLEDNAMLDGVFMCGDRLCAGLTSRGAVAIFTTQESSR